MLADLLRRCVEGDAAAFDQLVERYRGLVFSLCLNATSDWDAAEDLVQEVFIRVHARLPSLREPGHFNAWLTRIAINAGRTWRRSARVSVPLEEAEAIPETAGGTGAHATDTRLVVADALRGVPPANRVPLMLRHIGGYSYAEIAEMLHLPPATVKSRLHEGRLQARRELLRVAGSLLRERLPTAELARQVIARCGGSECACADEILAP